MFLCNYCERPTVWVDLATYDAFCNMQCRTFFLESDGAVAKCNGETATEVIPSTRMIRKMPRKMVCSVTGDQRCHILGLNAVKVIFNHYGFQCERIDDRALKELVIAVNALDNLHCCSPEQNLQDKYTEELFLTVFLYRRTPYAQLTEEALEMYTMMQRVFLKVQERLGKENRSPVIDKILSDFALVE